MEFVFCTVFIMAHTMPWKFAWLYLVSSLEKYKLNAFHLSFYLITFILTLFLMHISQTLRLSQKSLAETAPGKLVNLLSNDVQRFETLFCLHSLWIAPLSTIAATYLLWIEIQWAGIIGIATILSFIPIQSMEYLRKTIIQ